MASTKYNQIPDYYCIDIIQHVPSGEWYVARFFLAEDDENYPTAIIAAIAGPIETRLFPDLESGTHSRQFLRGRALANAESILSNAIASDTECDAKWANDTESWRIIASSV